MRQVNLQIDSSAARIALVAATALLLAVCYYAAKWGFANTAALRAEDPQVAEFAAYVSPDDPSTRLALARILERSFEPAEMTRSMKEYEIGASLLPHDFSVWLALGRARERDGEREKALAAFRRAQQLAPFYSRVSWALGNALVRDGSTEEGFAEIRTAFLNDDSFVGPAVTAAAQAFGGDSAEMLGVVGTSPSGRQGVIRYLIGAKRLDEAFAIWQNLPEAEKVTRDDDGGGLGPALFQAGRFRESLAVMRVVDPEDDANVSEGAVSNGGFETTVKLKNAAPFTWQIGAGVYPQIAITEGEKSEGQASLLLIFNSARDVRSRTIDQTIAVTPGAKYVLTFAYRSELKTTAEFRWEVANASDNSLIASSDSLASNGQWNSATIRFSAPQASDGIVIRLARGTCSAPQCSVAGNLWFDAFDLKRD